VLLDLERQWRVREFRSKSRNSWLLDETLTGGVVMTIANGAVAFE
jgi:dihydroorotase-like cyclic amidohydrolase